MGRFLTRLIDAQARWAKPFGDFNQRWLAAVYRPLGPLKDFLHGRWLGHPLHSAATDIPIGVLTLVIVLDVLGQPTAADISLVVGILFLLASAVTGAADYVETDGTARVRATVHSTLMVIALVVYLVSLAMRAGGPADRTLPIAVSIVAYLILNAGAYVGGDVVYALGNMVSRHAFRGAGTKWIRLDLPGELSTAAASAPGVSPELAIPEGVPTKAKLGINNLVLVRTGDTIHALHEVCAHAGGPLSEGRVVDGCIECPWHGSRFRLEDGRAARGPTVYDQPAYDIRWGDQGWEARRRPG
jgi:nitrite reductase/ring-hydroxylating ferredoxin subunit